MDDKYDKIFEEVCRLADEMKKEQSKGVFDRVKTGERNENRYATYLQTEEWKLKKNKVIDRDDGGCVLCGNGFSLNIHHYTYKNVYNEPLEELVTLCAFHHKVIHDANWGQEEIEFFKGALKTPSQLREEYKVGAKLKHKDLIKPEFLEKLGID